MDEERHHRVREAGPCLPKAVGSRACASRHSRMDPDIEEQYELWTRHRDAEPAIADGARQGQTQVLAAIPPSPPSEQARFTASDIRDAALSFPAATAQGLDGVHPRQVAFIGDELLSCLEPLLAVFSAAGVAPDQARVLAVPLIPKPGSVGLRPIGLFSTFYRLWARLQKPSVDNWETTTLRQCPFFMAGKGLAASDAVWSLAARHQVALDDDGMEAAAVFFDCEKLFDKLPQQTVLHRAIAQGVPRHVVRAAMVAYSWPARAPWPAPHAALAHQLSLAAAQQPPTPMGEDPLRPPRAASRRR